jgi:hypothetical protein
MNYTYTEYVRGQKVEFTGDKAQLRQYLIDYCKNHKKANVFNISRDFSNIKDENGNCYNAYVKFDRNWNFVSFKLYGRVKDNTPLYDSTKSNYEVTWEIRGRKATDFFKTRDEMLRFIKATPNYKFRLNVYATNEFFDVMFVPDKGLIVNNKIYNNF